MFKYFSAAAGALLLLASASVPAAAEHGTSAVDRQFVMQAAESGTQEVREGLVARRSADGSARTFGARMVTDHTKSNAQLKLLAQELGLSSQLQRGINAAPAAPSRIVPKEYLASQVSAHQTAIALFERESQQGGNASLRAFAKNALPVLRAHLDLAQQLSGTP